MSKYVIDKCETVSVFGIVFRVGIYIIYSLSHVAIINPLV